MPPDFGGCLSRPAWAVECRPTASHSARSGFSVTASRYPVVSVRLCQRARPNRRATRRRGATVVEFALVAPLFLLFIFALFEFGRYIMVQQALTNAAREGSRTAALATTTSATRVRAAVDDGLHGVISSPSDVSPVTVTVVPESLSAILPGTKIKVSVEVDASDVSWLPAFSEAGMFRSLRVVGRLGATSTHARE
ncbi:MAG: pilus assembly protein [Planctomycetia bacterium]|nr:pilus assembly protein [Planctomycetia bacterium]